jgi:hypothetical protein
MSSEHYPISLIQGLSVERISRVIADEFEDGTTNSRALWASKTFKRSFKVNHAPMNRGEMRWLNGFYTQRNGPGDSFWFRDNANRRGNASVRFSKAIEENLDRGAFNPVVALDEIAPVRSLPEVYEIFLAANAQPVWYFDANRSRYFLHMGTEYAEDSVFDEMGRYDASWQVATVIPSAITSQWQYWRLFGGSYGKSGLPVIELAPGQPAFSLFGFYRHSSSAAKQVICATGAVGAGSALGLVLSAANVYEPWVGGTETWTGSVQSNGTPDVWRSIAVVWAASSNTATMYVNGVSVGTGSNTRSLVQGPVGFGASPGGTLIMNSSNALVNADASHVMGFGAALTLDMVKALHNLFSYQVGLATV